VTQTVSAPPPPSTQYTLTVAKWNLGGSGTVTSADGRINCGSACASSYSGGTKVTLSAAPAAGSVFWGWTGACSGTGTCTVTLGSNTRVTALFGRR